MQHEMPFFSVIIAVYNGANCIARCLDSVLDQTYPSVEIVVVDDGSSDSTWNILNKYVSSSLGQLRAYHQDNHGVAYSRNRALGLVKGHYLMFLDADDWLDQDCLESYAEVLMGDSQIDIVCGGYRRVNSNGDVIGSSVPIPGTEWAPLSVSAVCSKAYRTDFLRQSNVGFPSLKVGEDVCFTLKALASSSNTVAIPYCGYNYLYNESGASTGFLANKDTSDFDTLLAELLAEIGAEKLNRPGLLQHYVVRQIAWYLSMAECDASERKSRYAKYRSWLDRAIPSWKHDKYAHLFKPSGDKFVNQVATWLFVHHGCLFLKIVGFADAERR